MKDTKLIEILKTFSKEEFKALEKFINSPYYKKRDVGPMFTVLKEFYPEFNHGKFTNENVYEKLFPGKKFGDTQSDSLLKTLSSEMFLMCKEFLIQIESNDNPNLRKYFLLAQLRKRKMLKEFEKESAEVWKLLETPGSEINEYLERYYISAPLIEYAIDKNDFRNCYELLIRQGEYLTMAVMLKNLRFTDQKRAAEVGYNLTTRKNLGESMISNIDMENFLKETKNTGDINQYVLRINYLSHMMQKEPDVEDHYYKFKELLFAHQEILSQREKYFFFGMAAGYCHDIRRGKIGLKNKREIFEIYDIMLKLKVYKFSDKDFFQPGLFRSMLIEARICKEYGWMKDLIDNYSDELHPDYKDNVKLYAMGQYYFTIGENGKALESLITLKMDYFLYKKDVKNLLFRIYYNLGLYEEAYSVLDSMKHYLASTADLSEKIKNLSLNFVRFAGELLRLKTGNKKDGKEYLLKKISKTKETESSDWLMEKVKEL